VEYSNSTDCNQFCYREGDGLWFTSIKALGTRCGDSQSCNYGDGEGYAIDTTQPIHGESTFTYVGNNLVKFTTSLSQEQGGTQVLSQTNSYQAYPEGFPENGRMGLLAQLWNYTETSGMAWLSGDNCPYNQGEGGLPSVEDVLSLFGTSKSMATQFTSRDPRMARAEELANEKTTWCFRSQIHFT